MYFFQHTTRTSRHDDAESVVACAGYSCASNANSKITRDDYGYEITMTKYPHSAEQNTSEHVLASLKNREILTPAFFIKPQKIIGKNVVFRDANKDDAEFILQLRTDPVKGKYLSHTSSALNVQVAWLEKYENDNTQVYFIIEDKNGERFGTIRLYDKNEDSFCWGSWILREGRPSGFAMESALMVYYFALSIGFNKSHFEVRKNNESVWQFHERFGAVRVAETDEDYTYNISLEAIQNSLEKYKKYLPETPTEYVEIIPY